MATPVSPAPIQFLKEVRQELAKVVWPTKKQVVKMTVIVIFVSIVVGGFIGGLDYLFTKLAGLLLK